MEYLEKVKTGKDNHYLICYSYAIGWIVGLDKFTSEDLIAAYNLRGENIPKEPRVWGSVIKELHRHRLIEHAGFSTYKKKCGHKKPVNVWKSTMKKL